MEAAKMDRIPRREQHAVVVTRAALRSRYPGTEILSLIVSQQSLLYE